MSRRQEVTDFIVAELDKIVPGDVHNGQLIRQQLEGMSDADFEDYMRRLLPPTDAQSLAEREILPFYSPNLAEKKIMIAPLIRQARDLGVEIYQRLVVTDRHTGLTQLTPHRYPVFDIPVRRQAQTLTKKSSIPTSDHIVDDLTAQPTSDSKGSKISSPELQSLLSQGLDNMVTEFIKYRGGDEAAYRELERNLIENGRVSTTQLNGLGITKSVQTLSTFFKGMHIGNNLDPRDKVPDHVK